MSSEPLVDICFPPPVVHSFPPKSFANGDGSKHGWGVLVVEIAVTSFWVPMETRFGPDRHTASENHHALVRTITTRAKVYDKLDILTMGSDPMVEIGRERCLRLFRDREPPPPYPGGGCLPLFVCIDPSDIRAALVVQTFNATFTTYHVFGPLNLRPPPFVEREN